MKRLALELLGLVSALETEHVIEVLRVRACQVVL